MNYREAKNCNTVYQVYKPLVLSPLKHHEQLQWMVEHASGRSPFHQIHSVKSLLFFLALYFQPRNNHNLQQFLLVVAIFFH